MHPRFKFILLVMLLAFCVLAGVIQYADKHPLTDADFTESIKD